VSHPPGPLTIAPTRLATAAARTLIAGLDAELTERYPDPGDRHFSLSANEVAVDQGVFLVARLSGEPVGCGALRRIAPGIGEIKRMYVAPDGRGQGIGRRLLAELERYARALQLRQLVLETGVRQLEAIGLYESGGFSRIEPFGEYVNSPASICMAKSLEP
jgi:GNAT superfamily N-acetyltransferase